MDRTNLMRHIIDYLAVEFPDGIQIYKRNEFKSKTWYLSESMLLLFNHTWLKKKEPVIEIRYNDVIESVIIDGLSESEFQGVKVINDCKINIVK